MVDAIELRMGNVLLWKEDEKNPKYVRVCSIKQDEFYFETEGEIISDKMDIWPVDFSDEIAIKLGFKKIKKDEFQKTWKTSRGKFIAILRKEEGGLFDFLKIKDEYNDGFKQEVLFKAEIPTLHDFQNIYYLLSHAEFEITL